MELIKKRGKLVITRVFLGLTFLVAMNQLPAFAQLGPKNGANLAATDLDRIEVGRPAPDFTLENMDGKQVSLSDFRGKKSVILVFYRGQW